MECTEALVAPSTLKPLSVPVRVSPAVSAPPATRGFDSVTQLLVELRTMLEDEAAGRFAVKHDYPASTQEGHMEESWRAQLVQWVIDVVTEFKFSATTAAAAVQLLDRFLSKCKVASNELQLLALVATFIASKLHESKPMKMAHIESLFRAICTVHDVRRAELVVSKALSWQLCSATAIDFVGHLTALIPDPLLATAVRNKAIEVVVNSMTEFDLMAVKPSVMALCAVACSYQLLSVNPREFFVWLTSCRLGVAVEEAVVFRLFSVYFAKHPEDPRCGSPVATTDARLGAAAGAGCKDDVGVRPPSPTPEYTGSL